MPIGSAHTRTKGLVNVTMKPYSMYVLACAVTSVFGPIYIKLLRNKDCVSMVCLIGGLLPDVP